MSQNDVSSQLDFIHDVSIWGAIKKILQMRKVDYCVLMLFQFFMWCLLCSSFTLYVSSALMPLFGSFQEGHVGDVLGGTANMPIVVGVANIPIVVIMMWVLCCVFCIIGTSGTVYTTLWGLRSMKDFRGYWTFLKRCFWRLFFYYTLCVIVMLAICALNVVYNCSICTVILFILFSVLTVYAGYYICLREIGIMQSVMKSLRLLRTRFGATLCVLGLTECVLILLHYVTFAVFFLSLSPLSFMSIFLLTKTIVGLVWCILFVVFIVALVAATNIVGQVGLIAILLKSSNAKSE